MIVVTGAAGRTGLRIIPHLANTGEVIRALVHREDQVPIVEQAGARETIVGDMHDRATLDQAVNGAQAVYHICPSADPEEATIGEMLIDAAKAEGVERFVFHSVMHPQLSGLTHHLQKLHVEDALIQSGVPFTILQPASYMQNILDQWDAISQGVYPTMYDVNTCVGMVDLDDVGEAAAIVLSDETHVNATYELCSGDCLSVSSIIELWEKHLGITIEPRIIPVEAWEERMASIGREPERIATLVRMFRYYEEHGFPGNANVLSWLLGRKATTYEEFVVKTIHDRTSGTE
ncbi:MAG TPA: NmrA family NAD(P)-binding protein [Candidatus Lokiarchaeia archaeon]|nr:NmrA family NAD(P)-binding protein [Candidatus Lokiarchaeia archaeon]